MERVNGVAPSSQPWHGRILLLNHTRRQRCPQPSRSRGITDSLALRTRPLCVLSDGDESRRTPGRSLPPAHIPRAGPLDLFRVQGFEIGLPAVANWRRLVRTSGNAPDPGTDLVRFRL